jgi:hypothetical protein
MEPGWKICGFLIDVSIVETDPIRQDIFAKQFVFIYTEKVDC